MKKQLIFETLNEFQQYISENNIKLLDLEIFEIVKDVPTAIKETVEEKVILPESVDIQLISLHDNPTITAKVDENNILYVDDIQMNENCCMPAVIDIFNRKVSVILCNEDGKTHANLSIALDNKPQYNVVFEVRKLGDEKFIMEIAKNLIEKIKHDT